MCSHRQFSNQQVPKESADALPAAEACLPLDRLHAPETLMKEYDIQPDRMLRLIESTRYFSVGRSDERICLCPCPNFSSMFHVLGFHCLAEGYFQCLDPLPGTENRSATLRRQGIAPMIPL
eukprot:682362-Amphidinium_carterae.1